MCSSLFFTMEDNEPPNLPDDLYIFRWTYYSDGTSEPPPLPKPEPSQEPPALVDIDKLIEESTGLYRLWWILFKEKHPERCLIREKRSNLHALKYPLKFLLRSSPVSGAAMNGHPEIKSLLSSVRNVIHPTGIERKH